MIQIDVVIRDGAPAYYFLRDGSVWKTQGRSYVRVGSPLPRLILASAVDVDAPDGPRVYHPRPMVFFYWIRSVAKATWDYVTWLWRGRKNR